MSKKQQAAMKAICGTLVVCVVLKVAFNPLYWSDERLRFWILSRTPAGSTRAQVLAVIADHRWRVLDNGPTSGVYVDSRRAGVGVGRIHAVIGEYDSPIFLTGVEVFWAFDEHSRLIDVFIRKTTDAP